MTNETVDPMSMHEQRSSDLARFVRGAALPHRRTEPMASCLSAKVRATATGRTHPAVRHLSPTAVASADEQDSRPAESAQPRHRLPAAVRRRAGPLSQRLVTPSPSVLPLREHLRSEAVVVHAPIVRSDPSGTDKTATALPPGTDPVPTDQTQIEQANDWR